MFKNNLRYYRLQKQLRKNELAKMCAVSPMCITNYEKGTRKPNAETLAKLAKALNITTDELLAEHENELTFYHDSLPISKREENKILAQVEETCYKLYNEAPDYLIIMPKLRKLKKVETLNVKEIRGILNAGVKGPIGNIITAVENAGIQVIPVNASIYPSGSINGYAYIGVNVKDVQYTQVVAALYRLFCTKTLTKARLYKLALEVLISSQELCNNLGYKRACINKDFHDLARHYQINFKDLLKHAEYNAIINTNTRLKALNAVAPAQ